MRKLVPLGAALLIALALVASVVTGRERPSQVLPEPAPWPAHEITALKSELAELGRALTLVKLELEDVRASLASSHATQPAVRPARTPPEAPPLPFRYLGRVLDGGTLSVFLARGEQHYSVTPGGRIDAQYRVDDVSHDRIGFTHLPTGARQTLSLPAVNVPAAH